MPVLPMRVVLVVGLSLLFAAPLLAQPLVAHLSHAEGAVTLVRRATPHSVPAGAALLAGDEIHTAVGRAEITVVDRTVIVLDAHTRVAFHAVDRVQLIDGRMFVERNGPGTLVAQTGGGRVHLPPMTVAEITTTAANRDLMVNVIEGDARVEMPWGVERVAATQSAFVSGPTGHPYVTPYAGPPADEFYGYAGTRVDFLTPPPTFLPYAHPVYRQQQYLRLLRKGGPGRHHDRPGDDGDRRRRGDSGDRGDRPQVNPLNDPVTGRNAVRQPERAAERREPPAREATRDGGTKPQAAPRTAAAAKPETPPAKTTTPPAKTSTPPARAGVPPEKPAAPPAKAARAGKGVRQP